MASSAFKYFCNNCLYYFGIGWNESGSVTFLSLLYFLWHVPNVEKFEPVRIFYDWLLIPDLSDEARSSVFISYFCMLPVILRWNFFHRLFSGFFFLYLKCYSYLFYDVSTCTHMGKLLLLLFYVFPQSIGNFYAIWSWVFWIIWKVIRCVVYYSNLRLLKALPFML